jgi:cell division protein FtsB
VEQEIQTQRELNRRLQARNAALDAEVRDLKEGMDAIEGRARSELGMVKHDEIFFQLVEPSGASTPSHQGPVAPR